QPGPVVVMIELVVGGHLETDEVAVEVDCTGDVAHGQCDVVDAHDPDVGLSHDATASSQLVPSKKVGLFDVYKRVGLANTKSRKSPSSISPSSTSSWASASTWERSLTSQWPMSDPKTMLSLALNGLTAWLNAQQLSGSSASQPK